MPFPLSRRGTLVLPVDPSTSLEGVAEAIEQALWAGLAPRVARTGTHVSFDGGFTERREKREASILAVTYGELDVERQGDHIVVRYHLSFLGLNFLTSLGAMFLATMAGTVSPMPPLAAVVLGVGAWTWLCGGNYVLSVLRFPRFLRKVRWPPPGVLPPGDATVRSWMRSPEGWEHVPR